MAVVGIDLGTTFSAIAALDEAGHPTTIPNRDGDMLTPSAVLIMDHQVVIGQAALDVEQDQPERVASLIKRRMGLDNYGRLIAGRDFRPETLSALILRKLVQDAELRLGPIEQAVITVPAYFDDTRRKATQDAGRIAGLKVIDIIDEPTAAALAYSLQQPVQPGKVAPELASQPRNVLVYDLGGGTFDVTVVRLTRKHFQTLAIEGDVRLGGKDWDDVLIRHVAEEFRNTHRSDPLSDPQSLASLHAAAERAKRTLSKLDQATITCTHDGKKLAVPISRRKFEELTRHLLTRTRLTTMNVLKQAKLSWEQVDRVLMVGGSTHMPMTRRMLRELSGKEPDNTLAVSEVVARGAAFHAGIIQARQAERASAAAAKLPEALLDVVEINVNAHSLGVEVRQGEDRINDILIAKNTQLPAAASRVYRTVVENQTRVRVRVLQGEAHQADACISIGECWIEDLPANLPKAAPIQVRCGCAANGLVDVMALDMTSGRMARTTIHRVSGLSDAQIREEAAWVAQVEIS